MSLATESGMVTAEVATVLPVVVLLLAMVLITIRAGVDQIRCVDAARAGARSAARGDDPRMSRERALEVAPRGARVDIVSEGAEVVVTVSAANPAAVPLVSSLPGPVARAVTTPEGAVTDVRAVR